MVRFLFLSLIACLVSGSITTSNAQVSSASLPQFKEGKSCGLGYNDADVLAMLKHVVYRIIAKKPDGSIYKSGTALAIDRRGFFLTAMHTVYDFPEHTRFFLKVYGEVSDALEDAVEVTPMWTNKNLIDLDVVVLKAKEELGEIPAIALHLTTDREIGLAGDYLGIPRGESTGGPVHVVPRSTEFDQDKVAKFDASSKVRDGHSGAMPVNQSFAAFAIIHKSNAGQADEALAKKGIAEASFKVSGIEGNYLVRPAILKKLKTIGLRPSLSKILEGVKGGRLPKTSELNLRGLIGHVTAIETHILLDTLATGVFEKNLSEDKFEILLAILLQYSQSHCLDLKYVRAARESVKHAARRHPESVHNRRFPQITLDRISSDINTAQERQLFLKSVFSNLSLNDAISTGQMALDSYKKARSSVPRDVSGELLAIATNALRWAEFGLSVGSTAKPVKNKKLAYFYTDLAFAEDLSARKIRPDLLTPRVIAAIDKMQYYGGTASGFSLASQISRRLEAPDAAFNFDAKALGVLGVQVTYTIGEMAGANVNKHVLSPGYTSAPSINISTSRTGKFVDTLANNMETSYARMIRGAQGGAVELKKLPIGPRTTVLAVSYFEGSDSLVNTIDSLNKSRNLMRILSAQPLARQ